MTTRQGPAHETAAQQTARIKQTLPKSVTGAERRITDAIVVAFVPEFRRIESKMDEEFAELNSKFAEVLKEIRELRSDIQEGRPKHDDLEVTYKDGD